VIETFGLTGGIGKQVEATEVIASDEKFLGMRAIARIHVRAVEIVRPYAKHMKAKDGIVSTEFEVTRNRHVVQLPTDSGVPK